MNTENVSFIENVLCVLSYYWPQCPLDVRYWISCQFALESGFGTSSLSEDNYNFCGMKNPLVRISCAEHAGDPNYHWASYDTLGCCIVDYLLCVQYHRPLFCDYDTVFHYSQFIRKFYCPERDYIDKINSIYQQFKNFKNG